MQRGFVLQSTCGGNSYVRRDSIHRTAGSPGKHSSAHVPGVGTESNGGVPPMGNQHNECAAVRDGRGFAVAFVLFLRIRMPSISISLTKILVLKMSKCAKVDPCVTLHCMHGVHFLFLDSLSLSLSLSLSPKHTHTHLTHKLILCSRH